MKALRTASLCLVAGIWVLCARVPSRVEGAQVPDCPPATEEKVLADFEDGSTEGWVTEYDTTIKVEDSDKARGKKWLSVVLKGVDWPGARFTGVPPDWSAWRAFRVSMYNPTDGIVQVSLRVDDADSTDYQSRFNWERGINLRPGANEVDVSLAALRMGLGGGRGLDVGHIKLVSFYRTFPGEAVPFSLDRLRLVPADRNAPERLVLADFEKPGAVRSDASAGVAAKIEERPDGAAGSALRVTFPEKVQYPRVTLSGFPADWLSYDFLCLDVLCAKEGPIPRNLYLDVRTENGLGQWLCTALEPGLNRLRVPLELIALPSLGNIRSLALFLDHPMKEHTIHVDDVRLERLPRMVLFGEAIHMDYDVDDGLRLNFRELELEGWSTNYGAIAWVPLAFPQDPPSGTLPLGPRVPSGREASPIGTRGEGPSGRGAGGSRMVRCTGRRGAPAGFTIPREAFAGMKPGAPVEVYGYFRSRNCNYFMRDEVRVKPGEQNALNFNDVTPFGY